MQRCVFSSSDVMILKIVGHAMNCVGVCQPFKDCDKRDVINRDRPMW